MIGQRLLWLALGLALCPLPVAACETRQLVVHFNADAQHVISFQYQDCPEGERGHALFSFDAENRLTAFWAKDWTAYTPTVQFFALKRMAPEQRIWQIAGPLIAPGEAGRCMVRPGLAPGAYRFTPVETYAGELEANGLWGACGPYGDANETAPYWITIGDALIAYVSPGLDAPPFDPASFRYRP